MNAEAPLRHEDLPQALPEIGKTLLPHDQEALYQIYQAKLRSRPLSEFSQMELRGYKELIEAIVAATKTTGPSEAAPLPPEATKVEAPVEKLTTTDRLAALEAATALGEHFVTLPERELSKEERNQVLQKTHDILDSRFTMVKLAILAASEENPPDLPELEKSQQVLTDKKIEAFEGENPGLSDFVSVELTRTQLGLDLMAAVVNEAIKIPEDASHSLEDYLTVYVAKPEELAELHKERPDLPKEVPKETIESIEGKGGAIDQLNEVVKQFELDLPSIKLMAAIDRQVERVPEVPETPKEAAAP